MAKRKNKEPGQPIEYLQAVNLVTGREEHTTEDMAKKSGLSESEVNRILSGEVKLGDSLGHLMVKKMTRENAELLMAFEVIREYKEKKGL